MAHPPLTLGFLAAALAIPCPGASDLPLTGLVIDSRSARRGDLFAALPGENRDGHDFIPQAVAAGCSAVLASRPVATTAPLLLVADVQEAMGRAARAWRQRVAPTVIGVTGSSGKTTVKEMLLAVLGRQFSTHATRGNLNNHLGVPMTLLRMPVDCTMAVVEMGMNHPGEIAHLADLAAPDLGIITNVHAAHLEGLGTVEAIARAKGELLQSLAGGVAILPADSEHMPLLRTLCRGRSLTFGTAAHADWRWQKTDRPHQVRMTAAGVEMVLDGLLAHGEHMVANATAVAAACHTLGVATTVIGDALAAFSPPAGRGALLPSRRGPWQVMDDCYNANPGSMVAALRALAVKAPPGHRVAVLGDMLELGPQGIALHEALAETVLAVAIDRLFTTGTQMAALHAVLKARSKPVCHHRDDPGAWREEIAATLQPGDVVLVKGSRGMRLERIVRALLDQAPL